MPQQEFDQYAKSYSDDIDKSLQVFGKRHQFFVEHKAEILGTVFDAVDMDRTRLDVLDVGCGVGLVHPMIVDRTSRLSGVDVSEASIEVARQTNPDVEYKTYDGTRLPYDDGEFDCAYAICVVHHVPVAQWQSFVAEMARVVRPGGVIAIIEHNPFNPATQWVVNSSPLDKDAHLVTPGRLKGIMKDAGLVRTSAQYVLFTPFEGKAFRGLDNVLSKVPLGAQYCLTGWKAAGRN